MSPDPYDRALDQPRPIDPRDFEIIRARVAVPAIFMILNGCLGLAFVLLLSGPLVFDPDSLVEFFRKGVEQQPPGPEKQDLEAKLAEFENNLNANRQAIVRQNVITLAVWGTINLVAIIGGLYMRRVSGYAISVAAGIVSAIPIATGCCFTGIPIGIWALVVLFRPDVKAAFVARRTMPPGDPDAQYMR